ncbi:MAG: hypothetical protein ACJAWW_000018 [Sulfurimonas sp.]|jgi:hypothetical protein
MLFFSGFSLTKEEYLLEEFLNKSDYCISGFSYGAIKAFNKVKEKIASGKRVDTLQLISPAFFQTKSLKFKRLQMLSFSKSDVLYIKQFISLCFDPYETKIVQNKESTDKELDELLNYEWDLEKLQELVNKGIKIEVYLGEKDKIIDVEGAREFFLQVATVTYVKEANHFLQIN